MDFSIYDEERRDVEGVVHDGAGCLSLIRRRNILVPVVAYSSDQESNHAILNNSDEGKCIMLQKPASRRVIRDTLD